MHPSDARLRRHQPQSIHARLSETILGPSQTVAILMHDAAQGVALVDAR